MKSWEEGIDPPRFSLGDRIRWLKEYSFRDRVEEGLGTVLGIKKESYGEGWIYVVLPDENNQTEEIPEDHLKSHDDNMPKHLLLEKTGKHFKAAIG